MVPIGCLISLGRILLTWSGVAVDEEHVAEGSVPGGGVGVAPLATATSSMLVEEAVESMNGRPSSSATEATPDSASAWKMAWTPIGAIKMGEGTR